MSRFRRSDRHRPVASRDAHAGRRQALEQAKQRQELQRFRLLILR